MARDQKLKIICSKCNNIKSLIFSNDDNRLFNNLKIEKVSQLNLLVFSLYCNQCSTKRPNIYINDKLAFDQNNLKLCINCNLPISIQRLETFPGTNVCAAECVEMIDKASKYVSMPPSMREENKIGKCGHVMERRYGRYGWFLGCSKYPLCKNTDSIG